MHWIEEVEMAKSIDDLVTSLSFTGRNDFSDYDMLDAMIASALKKVLTHVHFRKRVSVEEQRAQKDDRFLRGRQIRSPRSCTRSIRSNSIYAYRMMTFSFDTRWDQALPTASEIPTEMVLEVYTKLQDSV